MIRQAMSETRAREVIGPPVDDGEGFSWEIAGNYAWYRYRPHGDTLCLDGYFTADQLEAIAWTLRDITLAERARTLREGEQIAGTGTET